jgi:hypothetical protein
MKFFDIIVYIYCRLFGILREKKFIILPDGNYKRIYLNNIPTLIHDRNSNKDYLVIGVTSETVSPTMVYYYIKVEELLNNLNNKIMK